MLERIKRLGEALAELPVGRLLAAGGALLLAAGLFLYLYRPALPRGLERVAQAAPARGGPGRVVVYVRGGGAPRGCTSGGGAAGLAGHREAGGLLPDADVAHKPGGECRTGRRCTCPAPESCGAGRRPAGGR